MFSIFVLGALLGAFVFIITNINGELVIILNSKYGIYLEGDYNISKAYVVKRKKNKTGYNPDDWNYYDEFGSTIKDNELIKLIHSTFVNEDWYGDHGFYVNDEIYYSNIVKDNKEEIINKVEEMEDIIH